MPNILQKLIYNLSAAAPLLFVTAFVWYIENPLQIWKRWLIPGVLVAVGIVLVLIFNAIFKYAKGNLPVIPVNVIEVSGDDGVLVAYVISYLAPLASIQLSDYIAPVAAVTFILLMIVLTFTNYVSPNFLLFCKGYHFYEINVEGAQHNLKLASRKKIRKASDINQVHRVFEFLLIRVN